ncbi:MAG: hypothetical protein BAA02_08085 [Paenibacillaceae bacterium ZCTH02-B3]|nr:MAG: hypothetical protein BAA02_08085 [Paenibacillaceae bacterium ZCTH02-B3]
MPASELEPPSPPEEAAEDPEEAVLPELLLLVEDESLLDLLPEHADKIMVNSKTSVRMTDKDLDFNSLILLHCELKTRHDHGV